MPANSSNNVTKLRASDGFVLGTFTVGTGPIGVAFDGANIWVATTVGVAFDGANIWVANQGSSNVTKLRASDGVVLATVPVGAGPSGVAFDGANIWVANQGSNTVSKRAISCF